MKKDFYIFNNGELKRKENTLLFETEDTKKYIPIETVASIWSFGKLTINNSLLEFLSKKGVVLHYTNYYGGYVGTFYPKEHLCSGEVILKQAEHYLNYDKRLALAKEIIAISVKNIISNLKYYFNRGKDVSRNIDMIIDLEKYIYKIKSIEELMAIEGNIREMYYNGFNQIIKNEDFKFTFRSKRPPLDNINVLISLGNTMMYTTVLSEIYQTKLDPRIGYLHSTNKRKFSFNLDIAEIFKPVIVDKVIFSAINKGIVSAKDFKKEKGKIVMKEDAKRKFIELYNEKLTKTLTISTEKGTKNVSYKRLIRLECYKLQKYFIEDEKYQGYIAKY